MPLWQQRLHHDGVLFWIVLTLKHHLSALFLRKKVH
jgi:hypothetical protein